MLLQNRFRCEQPAEPSYRLSLAKGFKKLCASTQHKLGLTLRLRSPVQGSWWVLRSTQTSVGGQLCPYQRSLTREAPSAFFRR